VASSDRQSDLSGCRDLSIYHLCSYIRPTKSADFIRVTKLNRGRLVLLCEHIRQVWGLFCSQIIIGFLFYNHSSLVTLAIGIFVCYCLAREILLCKLGIGRKGLRLDYRLVNSEEGVSLQTFFSFTLGMILDCKTLRWPSVA
jgi:hypothetical protein